MPIDELAREIRLERIRRARHMTFEQKFLAGAELFDAACEFTLSGIRAQHPEYDNQQVLKELRSRLARREAIDNRHLRVRS